MEFAYPIIGYISAIFIGISLGLIGGGGSILTVPILVYLFHVEVVMATGYSLFIVGITSLFGAANSYRKKHVHLQVAFSFGLPSVLTVFFTRWYVLPILPDVIFTVGSFVCTKSLAILILFSLLMLLASISMIRAKKYTPPEAGEVRNVSVFILIIEGVVVGFLTGLVGAGGGFLIIPALVLFAKLPMKKAVGTSLVIIASKSLVGFFGDISNSQTSIDWMFLFSISALAILGILVGGHLSNYIKGEKLKPAFGWFVAATGIYILVKELFY